MQDVDALDKILKEFIDYQRPEVAEFYQAITKFKEDLPTLINTLRENIDLASKNNQKFIAKRDTFFLIFVKILLIRILPLKMLGK